MAAMSLPANLSSGRYFIWFVTFRSTFSQGCTGQIIIIYKVTFRQVRNDEKRLHLDYKSLPSPLHPEDTCSLCCFSIKFFLQTPAFP